MKELRRIIVKRNAVYGNEHEAYMDTLRIDAGSIRYEHKPVFYSEKFPTARTWEYITNNPEFAELFRPAAAEAEAILDGESPGSEKNIGSISFTVTYTNNTRRTRTFFLTAKSFPVFFAAVRKMVPDCEEVFMLRDILSLQPRTDNVSSPGGEDSLQD
ncbi:MAG: hypothetical protein J6P48_01140 [Oscillospiraceae bacterium]|nr:hypothetical protein [Oscillospiraceae bacterium]